MNTVLDTPFIQKSASHATLPGGRHPNDIRTLIRTADGTIWIGTAHGLFTTSDTETFDRVDDDLLGYPDINTTVIGQGGALYAGMGLGLACFDQGNWRTHLSDTWELGSICAVCPGNPLIIASTATGLNTLIDDQVTPVTDAYPEGRRIYGISRRPGSVLAWGEDGASLLNGDLTVSTRLLEGQSIRDIFEDVSITYFATADGLYKQDGESAPRHVDTPIRDIYAIARTKIGLGLGLATSSGVCIHADRWHYLTGPRWLPSDDTRALIQHEDTLLVATGDGLGRIRFSETTLADKEPGFQTRIRDRHLRLKGYVTTSRLTTPGNLSSNVPVPSDNDGLWTALYLAAQSYRYAVTGSDEARGWANQAFDAIEWLEAVTTVDGFPTKAIVEKDWNTGSDAVTWYPSADGEWLWKGDCSSDEIDGHMYGYSIFYDLAADDAYKERIVSLVHRIMDHIIGKDGKRTRWGVWAPEYLNGPWRAQRGLNSLEILSHLKSAHHITGDDRYGDAYRDLIENHGYAENARHVKLTLPGHVNHSDDELAFISYYPLLKYETDEGLRSIYLESLEESWQEERPERNPWWNYIYGAVTENACDVEEAARTLREIPLDLIDWPIRNSHRADIRLDADRGRKGELQSIGVLPYDELPALKWNANPYALDGGGNATREDDGTYFLLPYWMGRYYGFLEDTHS